MSSTLPPYFFRVRENGAMVFRVDGETRQKRIEMEQIAVVNVKNGETKPHGGRVLSDTDQAAIEAWMAERQATLAAREADEAHQTIERLNLTASWAQQKASEAELEAVADDLLMAMHDLRAVLIRKRSGQSDD